VIYVALKLLLGDQLVHDVLEEVLHC
jgi:hypothetical protein